MARDEEVALLAAVAGGDRTDALSQLYTRYEGRLYGLGCRLLGDSSLAEEAVKLDPEALREVVQIHHRGRLGE